MHYENFSDYEMRPLTPKSFLQEMIGRELRSLCHSINKDGRETNSALGHNLNSEVSKTSVIRDIITIIKKRIVQKIILHFDKISLPVNRPD